MRIWQRRKVKASDERKPASRVSRSASLKGRTKVGRFILQRINLDYHLVWRCTRLRELVSEHAEDGSLGAFLLEQLYSFVGDGWEQEDDITLLTLRRTAASR